MPGLDHRSLFGGILSSLPFLIRTSTLSTHLYLSSGSHGTCGAMSARAGELRAPACCRPVDCTFALTACCRRSAWDLWRREHALAHLPGPDHRGLFGGMDFISTKAVHRETAKLVKQYGPLFKLRILVFHVRRAARLWD